MTEQEAPARARLLQRASELGAKDANFARFLVHLANTIEDEDLLAYEADGFVAIARQSYAFLAEHTAGRHAVHIWQPEQGAPKGTTVIDIFNDDMPFLVDSSLLAIRAMGGSINLLAHPILPIRRRRGGPEVLTEAAGGDRISHVHVHVTGIADDIAVNALRDELDEVMVRIRRVVRGWRPMLTRLGEVVRAYRDRPPLVDAETLAEAMHFLAWLADHNFTFLGMREYRLVDKGGATSLVPITETGLGILEDANLKYIRQGADYVETTEQHMAYLKRPEPLLVTKANTQSKVHRRVHMDYIGVKLYGDDGAPSGELRVLGLFTSMSLATPHTEVPLVRRKIAEVMRRSGFDPKGHSGKALMNALDNYSRDELFQIGVDELVEYASVMAALTDRPRVRVLPRIDPFDNFVSVLVFLPRDRYDSSLRARVGEYLAERYDGRISTFYPSFSEGELVSVHFIIGRNGGPTPRPDRAELEAEVADLSRSFGDRLLSAAPDPASVANYLEGFSSAYQEAYTHHQALADIAHFESLADESDIALSFGPHRRRDNAVSLKIYHLSSPVPLSSRVPMLERFGFQVINERSYVVTARDGVDRTVQDMTLLLDKVAPGELLAMAERIETAITAVWRGSAENDGYNRLTIAAALKWDDAALIRAYGRYLHQIGIAYSQTYLATTLCAYPDVGHALVALFYARLDPAFDGDRAGAELASRDAIAERLDTIKSLDDDRIIRRFVNLVDATVRTNFFQRPDGDRRPALALKFDAGLVEGMPEPRPYREIWVYSPRIEGVHLRGGPVARGGLRWSDRPQDFRTEVLGLVKAQMVKNSVIVPVGAKGGFYPRQIPAGADREEIAKEGVEAYKIFVGSLLDVTDNLDADKVVRPQGVLCLDEDDPYLVVAADKGTAALSDTANAISETRGYWLSDAFASGGSAGYDHKKMGITARGAWEAVKRHFREMNHDIQTTPFTVAGVGDMSGDVFGNGMLLSEHIRLVAAFDHRDIFVDPDPDPAIGIAERRRLFEMGRSSWQDYDRTRLSAGGGVFSRSDKSVELGAEARELLHLGPGALTPQDVITAILRADVDLMWFGGIGTYVAATGERDSDVGDRMNDPIRVKARDIRAKVIGEGANLALSQRARIEYAAGGGRINTDAIDNSAGVNSSDLEVNIKIALGTLVRSSEMELAERNRLLVEMTDQVAALCLRNNYLQTLAISLAERQSARDIAFYAAMMRQLEAAGDLNRAVEYLPDDAELAERESAGRGLTRPEIAVLLAYAKNTLEAELVESTVPDDPYLSAELDDYFPPMLCQSHPKTIRAHRLRREIIATVLANEMINFGGPLFAFHQANATGADAGQIASAFAVVRDSFALAELYAAIDDLDNQVSGATQMALYGEVHTLLDHQTTWFLRHADFARGISEIVDQYKHGIGIVRDVMHSVLPEFVAESVASQAAGFVEGGAPKKLALRIAELSALTLASDVVSIAQLSEIPVRDVARAYHYILDTLHLGHVTELGGTVAVGNIYDRMALNRALTNMLRAQRELTIDILSKPAESVDAALARWHAERGVEIERTRQRIASILEGTLTVSRLTVAAGLLSDLARGLGRG